MTGRRPRRGVLNSCGKTEHGRRETLPRGKDLDANRRLAPLRKVRVVTSEIALTSHLVDPNYVAFSKAIWDGLTPEQEATVQEAADAAAESGR